MTNSQVKSAMKPRFKKTPEEQFEDLFNKMYDLCEKYGWGDPFSYARSREILLANKLKHQVASKFSGADGIDDDGHEHEYKTTVGVMKGSYTGISRKSTWAEQLRYLKKEKIAKYKNHYYARFEQSRIVEIYFIPGSTVLKILLPKFQKDYEKQRQLADPRLKAMLTSKEIYEYGTKIY